MHKWKVTLADLQGSVNIVALKMIVTDSGALLFKEQVPRGTPLAEVLTIQAYNVGAWLSVMYLGIDGAEADAG